MRRRLRAMFPLPEYAFLFSVNAFENFDGPNFTGPRRDVNYQAAYIEGGWFITPGDYRRFDRKTAIWGRTIPGRGFVCLKDCDGTSRSRGCGAAQLMAPLSYLIS